MEDCSIEGFDILSEWGGGYYHRYINCSIRYTKRGFHNYNANNLVFDKCRVSGIERLVTITGGTGPLTFTNGSIEQFTGSVFSTSVGLSPTINVVNTYIENYPNMEPPTGLEGTYNASSFIYGFAGVNVLGNTIFTNGIRRFIYGNQQLQNVVSLENNIQIGENGEGDLQYYIHGNTHTIVANDMARKVLGHKTGYVTQYLSSTTNLKPNRSYIYDPFKEEEVTIPLNPWQPLTLKNGWVAGSVAPVYRKNGRRVEIKGIIDGRNATANSFASLPSGYFRSGEDRYKMSINIYDREPCDLRVNGAGNMISTTRVQGLVIDDEFTV